MDFKYVVLLLCATTFVFASDTAENTFTVDTVLGKIKGSEMTSRLGRKIFAFRGIKYANPPVGTKRFKLPEPVNSWKDVFDATEEGPACIQASGRNVSEDCLVLNIYTTKLPTASNKVKRPVIVYFPAGSFIGSSAQSYLLGPQYYLDQDIVLVTINYRLGALGFLSTGDHHAPGNLGLKDQVLALQFLQKHIANFGGDPGSVTISGDGTSGWAVVLHMLSPMSRGLFHRVIAMSGAPFEPEPISSDMSDLAKKQACLVGCPTGDLDDMFDCLMKVPAQKFGDTVNQFHEFYDDPNLSFKPVVEPKIPGKARFLHAQPADIIRSTKFEHVPLITGITQDETVQSVFNAVEASRKGNNSYFRDFDKEWYEVAPIVFLYDRTGLRSKVTSLTIRKFFFGSNTICVENADKLGEIYSDSYTGFPVNRLVNLMSVYNSAPVYYYRFSFQGAYSYMTYSDTKKPYGVVHSDDLMYLFYISSRFPFFEKNSTEAKMVEKMTTVWTNFAKTGVPLPKNNCVAPGVTWDKYTILTRKYLEINKTLEVNSNMNSQRYALWDGLFPLPLFKIPGIIVN